jgi:hypothetical protein
MAAVAVGLQRFRETILAAVVVANYLPDLRTALLDLLGVSEFLQILHLKMVMFGAVLEAEIIRVTATPGIKVFGAAAAALMELRPHLIPAQLGCLEVLAGRTVSALAARPQALNPAVAAAVHIPALPALVALVKSS